MHKNINTHKTKMPMSTKMQSIMQNHE